MNLGILLWNTCNAKCSHCAVDSSPTEKRYMSDEQIMAAIDAAFYDCSKPSIGLSGGEAFVYFDKLCKIVRYATDKGALVSVNTNGYWGTSFEEALKKVETLKSIKLTQLVVSMDDFHEAYIKKERVINVIKACKDAYLEVELQYVTTKKTSRLADLLKEYGDDLLNIKCREIPCHPVGRAGELIPECDLILENRVPQGLCPSAILSISAYGKVIPCCNTAGHLPSLQIGTIEDALPELHNKFLNDALTYVLINKGPKALLEAACGTGYQIRQSGYVDQCHLCYDLFQDQQLAKSLRLVAEEMHRKDLYQLFRKDFEASMKAIIENAQTVKPEPFRYCERIN